MSTLSTLDVKKIKNSIEIQLVRRTYRLQQRCTYARKVYGIHTFVLYAENIIDHLIVSNIEERDEK